MGYGPFYIARERGFFKDNNLDVVLEIIDGEVERRAAIAAGRLDGIALTLDSMIVLRDRGLPLKAVMAIDASNGGDGLVVVKSIRKVEDLKGKEVAFPTGLPSHLLLYAVLKSHGMKVSDIKPVLMDPDVAGIAFTSGRIDAAVTWEPWLSTAREKGSGHVLADSKDFPGLIEDVLFMREDVIAKRPADLEGFIKAWYRAIDFVAQNPEEAKSIMSRAFHLPDDKVKRILPGFRFQGRQGNQEAFGTADKPGTLYSLYDRITEAWLAEGVITKREEPQNGLYPDAVRRVP